MSNTILYKWQVGASAEAKISSIDIYFEVKIVSFKKFTKIVSHFYWK